MPEAELLWGLALLGIALILVLIDIFVPSAGILGIVSLAVAIAGVVVLFRHDQTWGLIGMGLVIVGGPTFFFLGLRVMPSTPLGQKLILGGDPDGDIEGKPPTEAQTYQDLIGAEGEVVTDLRPVGTVRIAGAKFDALSETQLVRSGGRVKVTGVVDGSILRVRPLA